MRSCKHCQGSGTKFDCYKCNDCEECDGSGFDKSDYSLELFAVGMVVVAVIAIIVKAWIK